MLKYTYKMADENQNELTQAPDLEKLSTRIPKNRFKIYVERPREIIRQNDEEMDKIRVILQEQRVENERLQTENTHDAKYPELLNEKGFNSDVLPYVDYLKRDNIATLAIAYVDMDRLHELNEDVGHNKGSEVLGKLGRHLKAKFRREADLIARANEKDPDIVVSEKVNEEEKTEVGKIGGDEFLVAVVIDSARIEEFRKLLEQARIDFEDNTKDVSAKVKPSFSFGIAVLGDSLAVPYSKDIVTSGNLEVVNIDPAETDSLNLLNSAKNVAEMRMYTDKLQRGQQRE